MCSLALFLQLPYLGAISHSQNHLRSVRCDKPVPFGSARFSSISCSMERRTLLLADNCTRSCWISSNNSIFSFRNWSSRPPSRSLSSCCFRSWICCRSSRSLALNACTWRSSSLFCTLSKVVFARHSFWLIAVIFLTIHSLCQALCLCLFREARAAELNLLLVASTSRILGMQIRVAMRLGLVELNSYSYWLFSEKIYV